jgi:hypothetical protein
MVDLLNNDELEEIVLEYCGNPVTTARTMLLLHKYNVTDFEHNIITFVTTDAHESSTIALHIELLLYKEMLELLDKHGITVNEEIETRPDLAFTVLEIIDDLEDMDSGLLGDLEADLTNDEMINKVKLISVLQTVNTKISIGDLLTYIEDVREECIEYLLEIITAEPLEIEVDNLDDFRVNILEKMSRDPMFANSYGYKLLASPKFKYVDKFDIYVTKYITNILEEIDATNIKEKVTDIVSILYISNFDFIELNDLIDDDFFKDTVELRMEDILRYELRSQTDRLETLIEG